MKHTDQIAYIGLSSGTTEAVSNSSFLFRQKENNAVWQENLFVRSMSQHAGIKEAKDQKNTYSW